MTYYVVFILVTLGIALAGYLLGAIDTGIIVSNVLYHDDVRKHGSGGAGMTNMLRTFGKGAAVLTAAGDVLKGFAAALLGGFLFHSLLGGAALYGAYIASVAAVVGHWKPVYFGFKGGKGVLVAAGTILAFRPILAPVLAIIFLSFFLPTKMVSLGSIMMAASYPVCTLIYGLVVHLNVSQLIFSTVCTGIMGGLVLYMHRGNIARIRNGTEYRFDGKNKKQ